MNENLDQNEASKHDSTGLPPGSIAQQNPPPVNSQWDQTRRGPDHRFANDPRSKSPVLAGILSIMPGLGQVYTGYYQQGFINIIVIGSLISVLSQTGENALQPLGIFFTIFYWLFNVIDAYRRASHYNQALSGLGPLEIPEQPELPDTKGNLIGGVVLITFGGVALAHTLFDLSARWLEDWWPAALIIIGGYLIFHSVYDFSSKNAR
jgi:hypothetical protein